MQAVTHLRLPTHPYPIPTAQPLIHATRDITVTVKKVAQNPVVLAGLQR